MDWTQTLTILGVFIGGFFFLMTRMDSNQKENNGRFNNLENRLTSLEAEIKNTNQRIDSTNQRITDLKVDINQRLSNIESCVMPRKVFHFEEHHKEDHEEPKEN